MMRKTALAVCVFAALSGVATAAGPIQKVIAMLQENKEKVKADVEAERKEMAEYTSFCDKTTSEKAYAIKTAQRNIDDLSATITDCVAQIKGLADEIQTLGVEMADKEKELNAAAEIRKNEHTDFAATEHELVESVEQIDKVIIELKRHADKDDSFLQARKSDPEVEQVVGALGSIVDASWLDHGSQQYLKGLLQQKEGLAAEANEVEAETDDLRLRHTSSTHSESILEVLGDMKEKAESTLTNTRKTETQANHNYQMMKQSLTQGLDLLKEKTSEAQSTTAMMTEEKGKASGELSETSKTKLVDSRYLKTLNGECEEAARAWAKRQKSAKGEIEAIDKATEILGDVGDKGDKAMIQQPEDNDLTGALEDNKAANERQRVVTLLKDLGHKFHSFAMMEMVSMAATDPFDKIKGLISDMIAKLLTEAAEESNQKEFCDAEKAKSTKQKDSKSMEIDKLSARIDKATSTTAELKDLSKELQKELAEIDEATGEATKLRQEENANYKKASKDFKEAAEAVEKAISVLREFYAGGGFVQTKTGARRQPSFGGAKSDAAGGIIAILEMASEDFTNMYTQGQSEEMEAKAAYDKLMQESKVTTTQKAAEAKNAESTVKQLAVSLRSYGEDKSMTTQELDAVMSYLDKLKPQCETKVMSYQEKKAKRESEIEGLKEVLEIMSA